MTYIHHNFIYSEKHKTVCEEIKSSPLNISEGMVAIIYEINENTTTKILPHIQNASKFRP